MVDKTSDTMLLPANFDKTVYLHIENYLWFRQKVLDSIDKHLYELIDAREWDKLANGLNEIEIVLAHLDNLDKKFGLADDDENGNSVNNELD